MEERPVRLVVRDDFQRSRLTVFFRLLLAIPHFLWLVLWTIAMAVALVAAWLAAIVVRRPPVALARFLSAYLRYSTHFYAYLYLAANPFPGFTGAPGSYPIDVELDATPEQSRATIVFRLLLALPALLITAVLAPLTASYTGRRGARSFQLGGGLATSIAAFLGWFAALATSRMPDGFRNVVAYGLRYRAETLAYLFLLTDRYPTSDPDLSPAPAGETPHPIRLELGGELRRSRLTVFFRLLLAFPHFVWLYLWSIVAAVATLVSWIVTLVAGRSPRSLHRFLAAFVRYQIHVYAFLFLVANPFPGFVGRRGSYPVDLEIADPERQRRSVTAFRLFLAIPALFMNVGLSALMYVAALLGWFASLATGAMPQGLRNSGAYGLRYSGQVNAYLYLLTDRYPYSGPVAHAPALDPEPEPAA